MVVVVIVVGGGDVEVIVGAKTIAVFPHKGKDHEPDFPDVDSPDISFGEGGFAFFGCDLF